MPKAKRARKPAPKLKARKVLPRAKKSAPKKPKKAASRKKAGSVDAYVQKQPAPLQAVLNRARALVASAAPEAIETFKWGQPVFEVNGPMAYLKAYKTYVNFGFWRGAMLEAPDGTFEGDGDRMRHVKLYVLTDLEQGLLEPLIRQAAQLNTRLGNPALGRS